jgi:hypothetical protein
MVVVNTIVMLILAAALVKAVMYRLEWAEHRNPTPKMKRGEPTQLWLLVPLVPIVITALGWFVPGDSWKWATSLSLGLPFLLCKAEFWKGLYNGR